MDVETPIFEALQTLSNEADEQGLADVALVLEFAMDVFLHETGSTSAQNHGAMTSTAPLRLQRRFRIDPQTGLSWSTDDAGASDLYRAAS